jgi:hypothetical protein
MPLAPVQVYRNNGLTSLPLQQPYFMYNQGGYIDPDAERYGSGGRILKQLAPTLAGMAIGIPFGPWWGAAAGAMTGFGLGGFDNIMDAVSGGLSGYAGGSMMGGLKGLGATAPVGAGTGAQQAAQFATAQGMSPSLFSTEVGALMPGTGGVTAGPGLADFGARLGSGSLPASTSSFLPLSASGAASNPSSPFLNYGPQSGGVPGGLEQNIWNPALSPDTGGGFAGVGQNLSQITEGAGKAFDFTTSFDDMIASGDLTQAQVDAYRLAQAESLGAGAAAMMLKPLPDVEQQPGIGETEADMSGLSESEKLKIQQRLTAGKTFQPPNLEKYETGASPYGGVFGAQEGGRVPEGGLKEVEEINRFGNWLKENEASGWESDNFINFDNGGLTELPYPSVPGPDDYNDSGLSLVPDDYGLRPSYNEEGFPIYNPEDPYDAYVRYDDTPLGDLDIDVLYEELSKIKDAEVRANLFKEIFPNINLNLNAGHDFDSGDSDISAQFTMPFQAGGVTTPPQMNPQAMQHLKQEAAKGVPWAVELSQRLTPTRGEQRGSRQYKNGGAVWSNQRNEIARKIAEAEGTVIPEHMLEEGEIHRARRMLDRAAIDYDPFEYDDVSQALDEDRTGPPDYDPFEYDDVPLDSDVTEQLYWTDPETGNKFFYDLLNHEWLPVPVTGTDMKKGGPVLEGGSFVIPADVVSGVGDGSSEEGHDILTRMFNMNENNMAAGGLLKGPIQGAGGGLDDLIQTSIDGVRSARVSNDEFVVPSAIVNQLGGPEKLYDLMKNIRQQRTGTTEQPQRVNMSNYMTG